MYFSRKRGQLKQHSLLANTDNKTEMSISKQKNFTFIPYGHILMVLLQKGEREKKNKKQDVGHSLISFLAKVRSCFAVN